MSVERAHVRRLATLKFMMFSLIMYAMPKPSGSTYTVARKETMISPLGSGGTRCAVRTYLAPAVALKVLAGQLRRRDVPVGALLEGNIVKERVRFALLARELHA